MKTMFDGEALHCLVLTGTQASREVAACLASWQAAGLVRDSWIGFVEESGLIDATAPRLLVRTLSELHGDPVDLLQAAASQPRIKRIRIALLHDCDVEEPDGTSIPGYVSAFSSFLEGVRNATPRGIVGEDAELMRFRSVNVFAPAAGSGNFAAEAATHINSPSIILSLDDRRQPDAVAGNLHRDALYVPHVAAALATLEGLWQGFELHQLDEILASIEGNEHVRGFRQMVRLAGAREPVEGIIDLVSSAHRGGSLGEGEYAADTGTVAPGSATDKRLVSQAHAHIRSLVGDPVGYDRTVDRERKNEADQVGGSLVQELLQTQSRRNRMRFGLKETRETFVTSWHKLRLWIQQRNRESFQAPLEVMDSIPSTMLKQLQEQTKAYRMQISLAAEEPDAPQISPDLLVALKRTSIELVSGKSGVRDTSKAQSILSDRSLVAPHPAQRPRPSALIQDEIGLQPCPAYIDYWALGGYAHVLSTKVTTVVPELAAEEDESDD